VDARTNDPECNWTEERYRIGWSTPHPESGVDKVVQLTALKRIPETDSSWEGVHWKDVPKEIQETAPKVLKEALNSIRKIVGLQ
jgi:hypothetical protein